MSLRSICVFCGASRGTNPVYEQAAQELGRTLAAKLVTSGKIRVNSERVSKASRLVRAGDVLTFPLGPHIRVIKILAPGTRRGPASEAQLLYEDLSPPAPIAPAPGTGEREKGAGRPTKADRRQIDRLKRPQ